MRPGSIVSDVVIRNEHTSHLWFDVSYVWNQEDTTSIASIVRDFQVEGLSQVVCQGVFETPAMQQVELRVRTSLGEGQPSVANFTQTVTITGQEILIEVTDANVLSVH